MRLEAPHGWRDGASAPHAATRKHAAPAVASSTTHIPAHALTHSSLASRPHHTATGPHLAHAPPGRANQAPYDECARLGLQPHHTHPDAEVLTPKRTAPLSRTPAMPGPSVVMHAPRTAPTTTTPAQNMLNAPPLSKSTSVNTGSWLVKPFTG